MHLCREDAVTNIVYDYFAVVEYDALGYTGATIANRRVCLNTCITLIGLYDSIFIHETGKM